MNIDNSGPSIVFDAKTTQAIEEGKNRITLLLVEESRLTKLRASLLSDIAKLEAERTDKTKQEALLAASVEGKREQIDTLDQSIADLQQTARDIEADLNTRTSEIEEREADIKEREKELKEQENTLSENLSEVNRIRQELDKETLDIKEKKANIEELLKTL